MRQIRFWQLVQTTTDHAKFSIINLNLGTFENFWEKFKLLLTK